MTIEELQAELKKEFDAFKALNEKQANEIKASGETSTKTAEDLDKVGKRIEEIETNIKAAVDKVEGLEKGYQAKMDALDKAEKDYKAKLEDIEKKAGRIDLGGGDEVKSIGEQFVGSGAYTDMIKNKLKNSAPFECKGFHQKDILTSITGGNLVQPYRYPEIIMPPERALRIRDVLSVRSITENAIEYIRETGFVNAATMVAEGAEKPESNITFELKSDTVKTIAHWIPVSRNALEDASQIRAYVDTRLAYGIKLTEEAQILYGNGVAPNLSGIMPLAQSYKWSDGKVGDTKLDAIRRAMTKARLAEYPVNGVILHPTDWEEIELLKGSDKHYIWIVVTEGGIPRLWRVPVIETTAILSGEALTGAFGLGAMLWDREATVIRIAEQHEDFFIKNMVLILAEERLALTVFRPEAYVNIDFDAEPVAGS